MADWQLCLGFALPLSLSLFRLSSFIQMIYILYILIFTFNWQRNNFHAIRSKGLPHIRTSTSQNKKQPLALAHSPSTSPGKFLFLFLFLFRFFRLLLYEYLLYYSVVLFFVCRLLDCYSWQIKLESCKISLVIDKDTCVFRKWERERDSPSTLCTLCVFPESVNVVCRIESSSRNS